MGDVKRMVVNIGYALKPDDKRFIDKLKNLRRPRAGEGSKGMEELACKKCKELR